jgi:hypothetical protein
MPGSLLFVGDVARAEFAPLAHCLAARPQVRFVRHVTDALGALGPADDGDTILLAPAYRDEFPAEQVQQLCRRVPLADVVAVVSSWCEGETRSGNPWPGIRRVYVDQLLARWDFAAARMAGDPQPPTEWLPPTMTAEEQWLLQAERSLVRLTGCAAICGETPEQRDYLVELCQAAGMATVDHRADDDVAGSAPCVVLYDAIADVARRDEQVCGLVRRYPRAPLVVLMNFPRADEIARLGQWGALRVLGKPFVIDDLLRCVQSAMRWAAIQQPAATNSPDTLLQSTVRRP